MGNKKHRRPKRRGVLHCLVHPKSYLSPVDYRNTCRLNVNQHLEEFYCEQCKRREWYVVCRCGREYRLCVASPKTIKLVIKGIIDPGNNPLVSQESLRASRGVVRGKFEDVGNFLFEAQKPKKRPLY